MPGHPVFLFLMNSTFKPGHAIKMGVIIWTSALLMVNLAIVANYFQYKGSFALAFGPYLEFLAWLLLITIFPAILCTAVIYLIGKFIIPNRRKVQAMLANGILGIFLTSVSLNLFAGFTFKDLSYPNFYLLAFMYLLVVLFTSMHFFGKEKPAKA